MDAPGHVPPPLLPKPPNERLAVVSLACGIASIVLCLGPLTGIFAIVCGHVAVGRITRSEGALGGHGIAVTGLILGYFSFVWILIVSVLAALFFPAVGAVKENARRAEAKNTLMQLIAATKQYQTTYGHLPLSTASGGADFIPANGALLDVLRGLNAKQNPRGIIFFETSSNRLSGPTLLDPWGYPYLIMLDGNGDNQITVGGETVNAPVAAWSVGKNGRDESGASDDVVSWRPRLETPH